MFIIDALKQYLDVGPKFQIFFFLDETNYMIDVLHSARRHYIFFVGGVCNISFFPLLYIYGPPYYFVLVTPPLCLYITGQADLFWRASLHTNHM